MFLRLILPVVAIALSAAAVGAWQQRRRQWIQLFFATMVGTAAGSLPIAFFVMRPDWWWDFATAPRAQLFVPPLVLASLSGWLAAGLWNVLHSAPVAAPPNSGPKPNRIELRAGWDARPRDEGEKGSFSGRAEVVDRLATAFSTRGSGTILISGVRGVGKTAVVDYAIGEARRRMDHRWREELPGFLRSLPTWNLLDRFAVWWMVSGRRNEGLGSRILEMLEVHLRPVSRRVRNTSNTSARLLVLKFDAADIGATSDESKPELPNPTPRVSPEKLLRALIGKLHDKCHPSRGTREAQVLSDSFKSRKERNAFADLLSTAYRKSITKNYKETLARTQDEALKRSSSAGVEISSNLVKLAAAYLAFLGSAAGALWVYFTYRNAALLPALIGVPAGLGAVSSWLTAKATLQFKSDRSSDIGRKAEELYEFDYSLPQMEADLYELFRQIVLANSALRPGFERILLVFDELDKLEDALNGLKAVINHFKNLFTLSDALFVFITDQEFYEEVMARIQAAGNRGQYAPEHTFFTQRIYIRKPDFHEFQSNVYNICNADSLRAHMARSTEDDELVDYRLELEGVAFNEFPKELRTPHVVRGFARRARSATYHSERDAVYESLQSLAAGNPPVLAKCWTDLLSGATPDATPIGVAQWFTEAKGWENPEAVAHLYFFRSRFSQEERDQIESAFERLKPPLDRYTSLKSAPFTLTDAGKALCFKARNHYFDLYQAIYDYIGSYENGVPILWIEEQTARLEHRQWARYQRMIEEAYKSGFDDETSREFFNEILMESLYRVFDHRVRGEPTEVRNLAVSRNRDSTKLLAQRDFDQINRAVLYLLRLLTARNAIARIEEVFDAADLSALNFVIEWREDFDCIITRAGIALDEHEKTLLDFWRARSPDLSEFDTELALLWADAEAPPDAIAGGLRRHYARLRAAAEGLDKLTTSVSVSHAERLQRETRSLADLHSLIPSLLMERIRAEEGAQALGPSGIKGTLPSAMSNETAMRITSIQIMSVPLFGVAYLTEPDFRCYVLSGPYPAQREWLPFKDEIQAQKATFVWYVPERRQANMEQYVSPRGEFAFLDENPLPALFSFFSHALRDATEAALAQRYDQKPDAALAVANRSLGARKDRRHDAMDQGRLRRCVCNQLEPLARCRNPGPESGGHGEHRAPRRPWHAAGSRQYSGFQPGHEFLSEDCALE